MLIVFRDGGIFKGFLPLTPNSTLGVYLRGAYVRGQFKDLWNDHLLKTSKT